jgi:hypothetical protein
MIERERNEYEKSLGFNARKAGLAITENPFQRPVIDRPNQLSEAWRIGWKEADALVRKGILKERTPK